MDSHDEYAALLDAFIDGELSAQDAQSVWARMSDSDADRAYIEDALAMREWFPDVEETVVPDGFTESVLAALPARERPASLWRSPWVRAAVPLVACVTALLLVQGVRENVLTGGATGMSGGGAAYDSGVTNGLGSAWDEAAPEEASTVTTDTVEEDGEAELYDAASMPEPAPEPQIDAFRFATTTETASEENADAETPMTPEPSNVNNASPATEVAPSALGDDVEGKASGNSASASKASSQDAASTEEDFVGSGLDAGDTEGPSEDDFAELYAAPVTLCAASAEAVGLMEPYAFAASTERGTWYVLTETEFAELREQLLDEGYLLSLTSVAPDALPDDAPPLTVPNAVYVLLQAN